MTKIAIVYFSGSGHTHLTAEAIALGSRKAANHVDLLRITGEQITNGRWQDDEIMAKLNQSDAIIFGSPTYMGGVAAQFKAFLDAQGLPSKDISYSEQGMQGDNYVSLDILSAKFLTAWASKSSAQAA